MQHVAWFSIQQLFGFIVFHRHFLTIVSSSKSDDEPESLNVPRNVHAFRPFGHVAGLTTLQANVRIAPITGAGMRPRRLASKLSLLTDSSLDELFSTWWP